MISTRGKWLTLRVRLRVAICCLAATALVACTPLRPLDDDDEIDAASIVRDAGPAMDAARDARVAIDATLDAPGLDAPPPDAFSADAFAPDVFVPRDAFVAPDAWVSSTPVRPSAVGSVVFSELMIEPRSATQWVELYNPSATQSFDLRTCSFDGMATSHPIAGTFVIPPRSYGVASASFDADIGTDYLYGTGTFLLERVSDRAALVCGGVVIDEVLYGRTFPILEQRSIMVASSVLGGSSPHLGNDVADAWCSAPETARYSTRNYGTPGAINTCPP